MYYFAYGSNMSFEHMRRICGWHFTVIGVGKLNGYEFGPDGRGYANVRKSGSNHVYGVLYELDQYSLDALDEFEGYPDIFGRNEVEVEDENMEKYTAWVYMEKPDKFNGDYIRQEYLKRVISGAVENRLPEEWIKFLTTYQT